MNTHQTNFVRTSMIDQSTPPVLDKGYIAWIRKNLLATPLDAVLTIIAILALAWFLPPAIKWLFIDASWTGGGRGVCATAAQGGSQPEGWSGACWAFVGAKFDVFMFGRYPVDERWRPMLVGFLFVALLVPILIPKVPYKSLNAILLFGVLPILSFFVLIGGVLGLSYVETPLWGGLMVTLILSFVGIAVSLPLGIVLALGRRSTMPVIRLLCTVFIEIVRGIPLITVLFMASGHAALVPAPGHDGRQVPQSRDRGVAFCFRLYGRSGARRPAGHPEGTGGRRRFAWLELLAEDAADHPAAGVETGHSRHRQHLYRPVQGYVAGVDHRHVRSARHRPAEFLGRQLGIAGHATLRSRLCRIYFLAFLLRYVALFRVHGTKARQGPQTITNKGKYNGS